MRHLRSHWIAATILVVRAALGIFYSVTIPIWEAFDEPGHYEYVRYIVTRRTLPRPGEPEAEKISEIMQPPLYYLLGALSTMWIDVTDDLEPNPNPFFPAGTGGLNYAVHPDSEHFPYQGTVLAVHTVRGLSVAISLVGILLTYLIGLTIAPSRREIAIGAMAIHAFWPQFLFNGSVVTNDVLASAIGSAIILILMRMVQGMGSALQTLGLGLLFGLGLLSKLNTLALLPVAALVMVGDGIARLRHVDLRRKLGWAGATLASVLALIIGWSILRSMNNVIIPVVDYEGGPFSEGLLAGLGATLGGLEIATAQQTVSHTLNTFWALFGWGNIAVDSVVYDLYALVLGVAAVGLLLFFLRRRRQPSPACVAVLLAAFVAVLGLPLLLVAAHGEEVSLAPGRYLMPAISAFSVLLLVGCDEVSRFRGRSPLPTILIGALLLFAVLIPCRYIRPAYARPALLSPADVQGLEHQLSLNFGGRIGLLAYDTDRDELEPGQRVGVTLYWRALTEMKQDYTVCVRFLGPHGDSDDADCTYPGRGNYATSLWKAGDIFRDQYNVRIPRDFPAPSLARINVAIFRYPEEEYLTVDDPGGPEMGLSATFGRVKVSGPERPAPDMAHHVSYSLGDTIALIGYDLEGPASPGNTLTLRLYWSASGPINEDYTVFVHLVDRHGELWAQHDGQPRSNTYPTGLWDKGEIIEDELGLALPADIPAGNYEMRVGMYSLETMQRLPAVDERGNRLRDDAILLTEFGVESGAHP
jgi:4-amino-4-deoxy-L-arabinose transferase-like glycosyltransferase